MGCKYHPGKLLDLPCCWPLELMEDGLCSLPTVSTGFVFYPEISRKAIFSAWITTVPGEQENSWMYLLASQTAIKGKIHLHPHHFLLHSSSFQPSIYLQKSLWKWGLCTHRPEEFAFVLSHGTRCCSCYSSNKTLPRCPFINLLSSYNGK